MKNNEFTSTDKFWVIVGIFLFTILGFAIYSDVNKVAEQKVYNPHQTMCYSKTSGSRPACWTQDDWKAYCDNTGICKK